MRTVDVNGFMWPEDDVHCKGAIFASLSDITIVCNHVRDFRICVQAGGNCGVWPKKLSKRFGAVYTFEPDPLNFHCLVNNCPEKNIIKLQAAVGHDASPVGLIGRKENIGAHQVEGFGAYPVIAIDELNLPSCGLMYLDIEGYEGEAIDGAMDTIERFKPIIAIENKGHSDKYGISPKGLEKRIISLGYKVVDRPHRDTVFAPEDQV